MWAAAALERGVHAYVEKPLALTAADARALVDLAKSKGLVLAGGTSTGLVYPFDFPDPDVILAGQTYYAYATNSVAGNIQIIDSPDLSHWTAVGNALPSLPAWASANYTWAPSVANIGGVFALYYAVDVAGTNQECISVATAAQVSRYPSLGRT